MYPQPPGAAALYEIFFRIYTRSSGAIKALNTVAKGVNSGRKREEQYIVILIGFVLDLAWHSYARSQAFHAADIINGCTVWFRRRRFSSSRLLDFFGLPFLFPDALPRHSANPCKPSCLNRFTHLKTIECSTSSSLAIVL
jgi:hypothetical protein